MSNKLDVFNVQMNEHGNMQDNQEKRMTIAKKLYTGFGAALFITL